MTTLEKETEHPVKSGTRVFGEHFAGEILPNAPKQELLQADLGLGRGPLAPTQRPITGINEEYSIS